MPISSLIIRVEPERVAEVCDQLAPHPAIDVSQVVNDAIAVVTETPDGEVDKHLWKQIESIPGVTHVELIYHNFEDLGDTDHAAE